MKKRGGKMEQNKKDIKNTVNKTNKNGIINIAIDGPAGSGKSTISRAVAKKMGIIYVDTGALYRSVALKLLAKKAKIENDSVEEILKTTKVELKFVKGEQKVFLDGTDVTDKIRTPEVSMTASSSSALPNVRKYLLNMQQSIAKENSVVMDGRDIGTVVLPNADIKIFLTASAECRAKRRWLELTQKGQNVTYEEVLKDQKERDYNDSHRKIAPLKPCEDSVIIDTTELSLEQSVEHLYNVIQNKLNK